ncbi:MAG TPA: TIGR03620 family F420-dependent LLM class oxidoreductase [Acidimicrobiales bacterium]
MDPGRVGLWTFQLDLQPAARAREVAAELDELGYGALWIPDAIGREPISHAAVLLGATERTVIATGVANIWHRSPHSVAAAQNLLADVSGGRFLLGLGVSHAPVVEGLLGETYLRPLDRMRSYLDAIDDAFSTSPPPPEAPPRVLAALGPRMLELAATRAWGALTYFVPVEHTAMAREHLGPGPQLMVEQAVVLLTDADVARAAARKHMDVYLGLPNYRNNLVRLGWGDDDLGGGGSDALVDALVAWGDVAALADRVRAHHEAGADHVCLQVLDPDVTALPMPQWRELAAALVTPTGRTSGGRPTGRRRRKRGTGRPARDGAPAGEAGDGSPGPAHAEGADPEP